MAILFYTTKDTHGYMSNFARFAVELDGRVWMTSEHWYQAQKFKGSDPQSYEDVFNAPNPGAAATIGRDPNRKIRPNWDRERDDAMRRVVLHKFLQHVGLRERLLSTGDERLVEHDTKRKDAYWGDGGDDSGKNMLGVILMEVREVLRLDAEYRGEPQNSPVMTYLSTLKELT